LFAIVTLLGMVDSEPRAAGLVAPPGSTKPRGGDFLS